MMARKVHKLFAGLLSVNNNCGAVEVPTVNAPKTGVDEVPTATYVPLSKTEPVPRAELLVQRARKLVVPEPETPDELRQVPFTA